MKQMLTYFLCAAGFLSATADRLRIPVPEKWTCAAAGPEAVSQPEQAEWKKAVISSLGRLRYHRVFRIPKLEAVSYKTDWTVPETCGNRNLILNVEKGSGNMTVFVNGKKAGMIPYPAGMLNLKGFLEPGKANCLEIHVSKHGLHYINPRRPDIYLEGLSLSAVGKVYITDVFANPSWRKKSIEFETEILAEKAGTGELIFHLADQNGKTVKTFRKKAEVKPGINLLKPEFPWNDFTAWEIGRPWLYTCSASFAAPEGKDAYPAFTFGFRELWREGKEIIMNGHIQRFRPCYAYGAGVKGAEFLNSIGYNQLVFCHVVDTMPSLDGWNDEKTLSGFDRLGMAIGIPTPSLRFIDRKIDDKKSPAYKEYYRCMKYSLRRLRNHPSVCTAYVSLLMSGSVFHPYPEGIGQSNDRSTASRYAAEAARTARFFLPGILYSGFGDGCIGDIGSTFAYLNFTPLQEREEWLSQWSRKGVIPITVQEFGTPYDASFWKSTAFLPAEYAAMYYGDRVYLAESEKAVDSLMEIGLRNKNGHGGRYDPGLYPYFYDFYRLFVRNTRRGWRAYGFNGGGIDFNLRFGFGNPPGVHEKDIYGRYSGSKVPESYRGGKPDWANTDYDIYRQDNLDFTAFIGGFPEHTDKDHSFFPGGTVQKNLVAIWDGAGTKSGSAEWVATLGGKRIASGKINLSGLKTGDIVKKPFSFRLPAVGQMEKGKIELTVRTAGEKETIRDSFAFEVYPEKAYGIPSKEVLLFDPDGKSTAMLDKLGVKYKKVNRLDESVRNAKYLILGRFSLGKTNFPFDRNDIRNGLNVLILPQMPAELKALGFRVEDRMSRTVFLRDKFNPAFSGIADETLSLWSGTPDYGKPYGNLTGADTQRFTHWKRTHTVAGCMIQIPEHGGFLPLMDGEFDMNFSPLLRWQDGKGSITFCTLDGEERPGTDPAPLLVMSGVLKDFLNREPGNNFKKAGADGPSATKLLQKAGITPEKQYDILVADSGSKLPWSTIREQAEQGKSFLIYANARIAKEAGFQLAPAKVRRLGKAVENTPLLRGIGPSLLRWRAPVDMELLTHAPANFTILADGIIAESKGWKGKVVFVQADPFRLEEMFGNDLRRKTATFLSTERMIQLGARLLTNLGAEPGTKTAERLLYQAETKDFIPLKAFFVLGPFDARKDDGNFMLKTVFSGEASAIQGNNAPEENYKLPQGGTANWRTTASADDKGFLDLGKLGGRFSRCRFAVNYAMHFFDRKSDEDAILRFDVDWRAKIWCNGKLVFMTSQGAPGKFFEVRLTNLKKGRNVLSFKIGAGSGGCNMTALLTPEHNPNAVVRKQIPGLQDHQFYERTFPVWDPYQHVYW